MKKLIRWVMFAVFTGSSLFHLAALKWPHISVPEPVAEHIVFAVVNAAFAVLSLWATEGTRRFFFHFSVLAVFATHQFPRHLHFIIVAAQEGRFDFQSTITIVWLLACSQYLFFEDRLK